MAKTSSPGGLKPIRRSDGMSYAGAVEQYLVNPAGIATNLFTGQVVAIGADGFITLVTSTGADGNSNNFPVGTIGVFLGVEYINGQGQLINDTFYPAGYAAPVGTAIKAFVVADPNVLFKAQMNGVIDQSDIGANTFFAAAQSSATGTVRTGNSTSAIESNTVTTAAAFRIVAVVSPIGDAFPDVLIKFNPGFHSFTNAVGI